MHTVSVALVSLALVAIGYVPNRAAPVIDQHADDAMDAYIDDLVPAHRIPGLAVAVTEGSETVYRRTLGRDGAGEAIGPSTPFLLGSIAKSSTATLVMQLVEAGEVDLDTAVATYLDGFAPPGGGDAVTVRHLLSHTSGRSTGTGSAHSDRFDDSPDALANGGRGARLGRTGRVSR